MTPKEERVKNNMIKAYRAGGLSTAQQHYINQKLDEGKITQEELDGKKEIEEVTEEVSPSFIDRITTSIKEKSIPEFKQDVSAIKDLGVGIKDVALKSIKNAAANPDKVMELLKA